jgi:hypothetical protein
VVEAAGRGLQHVAEVADLAAVAGQAVGVGVGHVHAVQRRDRVDGHVAGGQRPPGHGPDQAVQGQTGLGGDRHDRRRHHHPDPVVTCQQGAQGGGVEMVEVLVGGQHQLGPGQVADAHRRREPPAGVVGEERVDGQAGGRGPQQEAGLPDPGQPDAHAGAPSATAAWLRVQV